MFLRTLLEEENPNSETGGEGEKPLQVPPHGASGAATREEAFLGENRELCLKVALGCAWDAGR